MRQILHAKERLDLVDRGLVRAGKDRINMSYNSLNIRRTVLRHILPNRLKVRPIVHLGLDDGGGSIGSIKHIRRVRHRPSCERTRVTSTDEHPRRFTRLYVVSTRHGQVDGLGEVDQVSDGLVQREELQALDGQVRAGVGETKETVLDKDGGSTLLLRDHTVDSHVREVTLVPVRVGLAGGHEDDRSTGFVPFPGVPVALLERAEGWVGMVDQLVEVVGGVVWREGGARGGVHRYVVRCSHLLEGRAGAMVGVIAPAVGEHGEGARGQQECRGELQQACHGHRRSDGVGGEEEVLAKDERRSAGGKSHGLVVWGEIYSKRRGTSRNRI
jgi:hypothetical protein